MSGEKQGALAGTCVLDAGILVQGPCAGQILSDLGADVIKVELPGTGDYSRWLPASPADRRAPWYIACNRGKRSLALDLRTARGASLFRDLAERADVVISNFLDGTMESWGLGYEQLSADNPGLIVASASAFGSEGELACQPGTDLGGQAAAGLIGMTGSADSEGYPVGVTIGDHLGALNLTIAIIAALLYRARTGRGQHVRTSLLGSLICAQGAEITGYAMSRCLPRPAGNGHSLIRPVYSVFDTSDGRIAITDTARQELARFLRRIGIPISLINHGSTGSGDAESVNRLYARINEVLGFKPTKYWCEMLCELKVVHAVVRDYSEIISEPSTYQNDFLQKVIYPDWGEMVVPGTAITFSESKVQPGRELAAVGEHGEHLLREVLGLSASAISSLRAEGVI